MTALSADELMRWADDTSQRWFELLGRHPESLGIECDIMNTGTVAKLVQHIVAVELRYADRLQGVMESSYEHVPFGSAEELSETHRKAMEIFNRLLLDEGYDWEQSIQFQTRSAGVLRASRRTVLVHALMHTIRHYAQLATLVRQHGVKPDWPMDYLFMGATHVF